MKMDCKIWENTILAWVNSLNCGSPVNNIDQLNDTILINIIRKFKFDCQNPIQFLQLIFPNLLVSDSFTLSSSCDFLSAATCLLVYVSYTKKSELDEIRNNMCVTLDNTTQCRIAEFLTSLEKHKDVFQLSFENITKQIYDFVEIQNINSCIGDSINTPVKSNIVNSSFESPLQGFFQTPKRNLEYNLKKPSSAMCGDGDHLKYIKQLTDQLVEEESEKASLQGKLMASVQKCNDFEMKLKDKIEEIKHLKYEWEKESKKNENDFLKLKSEMGRKFEEEKKLKSEINQLESFVSSLESDLSNSVSERSKLEYELKICLEKYAASELQAKEVSLLNLQLQDTLANKEKDLLELKENLENAFKSDKAIDLSFADGSFENSICSPENMGVVIEKILHEKIEENTSLKETIDDLRNKKNEILLELEKKKNELADKNSKLLELQNFNKELENKIDDFVKTEKELLKVKEELFLSGLEVNKLLQENCELNEKYNTLSNKALEQDQALLNFKNTKMLIYFDYLKLADDFKTVQERLEFEVNNIVNLMSEKKNHFQSSFENNENIFSDKNMPNKEKLENSLVITKNANDLQINKCSDNISQKILEFKESLNIMKNYEFDWSESKSSIQKSCMSLNDSIITLKLKIKDLEENQKNSLQEKVKLENHLKINGQKMFEIQNMHSSEIKKLNAELDQKNSKIIELEEVIKNLKAGKVKLLNDSDITINQKTIIKTEKETLLCEEENLQKTNLCDLPKIRNDLIVIDHGKSSFQCKEELNDSLEEVIANNKTFDIVNVEEKGISDKTFSVDKRNAETRLSKVQSWSVSPPSKNPQKKLKNNRNKGRKGESWEISLNSPKKHQEKRNVSSSTNDLTTVDSCSNLTKSSSLSSIMEMSYLPPSKIESKSSGGTTFFSFTNLSGSCIKERLDNRSNDIKKSCSSEVSLNNLKLPNNSACKIFKIVDRREDPLKEIFKNNAIECEGNKQLEWEKMFSRMRKEIIELSNESERLRSSLSESEKERRKQQENYRKSQNEIAQNISAIYETRLEQLKCDMKRLHSEELSKYKAGESKLCSDLKEQNKRHKEYIDQLRNQLWDLREKLLQEQKQKRDLERMYSELKKKYENSIFCKNKEMSEEMIPQEDDLEQEKMSNFRQFPNSTFPTMPTEDEDEIFDNRFLEDMKKGFYPTENPEGRLLELQNRNTLCLPHLKSSYPAETQFLKPSLFNENDIKHGLLQFGQESQSLTDSDHSMTRSLLPENKGKKKEQTSYKKPGPPTPSKHGRRFSIQGVDFRITPRSALREISDQNEKNKNTPSRLKTFLPTKNLKKDSLGGRDENIVPVTPRKKLGKIFRKPFGARDH